MRKQAVHGTPPPACEDEKVNNRPARVPKRDTIRQLTSSQRFQMSVPVGREKCISVSP